MDKELWKNYLQMCGQKCSNLLDGVKPNKSLQHGKGKMGYKIENWCTTGIRYLGIDQPNMYLYQYI